jgi:putative ABC transport system permease protein
MLSDLRYALRSLLKAPGFTAIAVLTLTLAIGANTAIFSLIHDLFLRGLPFKDPSRIVHIYGEAKERDLTQLAFSVPKFWHYRDAQTAFSEVGADWGSGFVLSGQGEPVQVIGENVTANYFDLLGIHPFLGRNFRQDEEMHVNVALVTESFWRNRLGSDPAVLGRSIALNGVATTIVGVLPNLPISWFGRDAEVFTTTPFDNPNTTRDRMMRGYSFMRCIGRLKPGVSIQQAQATMPALEQSYRAQYPEAADSTWTSTLAGATEDATADLRPAFVTLLVAVSAVLLIACSNVANLLLVRFSGRRREIALRMALGAERRNVVRLFVLESTTVSLIAGVLGLGLALWIVDLVPKVAGDNVPLENGAALHWPVLVFTLALSLITGIAIGAYPAWQSSRADLVDGLKESGRAVSGSRGQHRFRRGLVAAQVALSMVLLAAAAMLISSFVRLSNQATGFSSDHVWSAGIGLPASRYPDPDSRGRFVQLLLDELQAAPGVEFATVTDALPLSGNYSQTPYARPDTNPQPVVRRALGLTRSISPAYFQTLRVPVFAGREFSEHDRADAPPVVILSSSTAKKLFPNESPLGHQMLFGVDNGIGLSAEIVGIVADVRSRELSKSNEIEFYRPWPQRSSSFCDIMVRSSMKFQTTTTTVRRVLDKIDKEMPILQPRTLDNVVKESLGQKRLTMGLLGAFAGIALLLAIVGIYGAVAYTVEQRTAEIGVRMALGAQVGDVLQLVIRQGMNPVLTGLVIGLIAIFVSGQFLAAQLYQVSPSSPILLGLTATALAVAALLACLIPARRAAMVDPVQALRTE